MSAYFLKNTGSDLDHTFEWAAQILDGGETIESDLGWTLHPADDGLIIDATNHSPTTTTVRLSGGVPGRAYLVCSNIHTSTGREIQNSIIVRVANG
ncbi:MAG: hypothetical protein AAFV19_19235 [Pseudomonadota bacterium]